MEGNPVVLCGLDKQGEVLNCDGKIEERFRKLGTPLHLFLCKINLCTQPPEKDNEVLKSDVKKALTIKTSFVNSSGVFFYVLLGWSLPH